ncbi:BICD family-like cargo adapter 1 [Nothobranchius furzeri]|uniref:Bicaudal D-related protein 1-like n=3 Tax=Nothobranchius furzeri TaxID=105023 RepID=A0A1A8V0B6_NOTFU|nr:BICD family-like cargo adapter 1 [Nothobranchius furzeri]KAF7218984.1 bicaudal D-related protein 1-like [Nothobranchius furzeri]
MAPRLCSVSELVMDRLDGWSFTSKKMNLEEDFYFDYGTEEITDYQDPSELLAALKQKEEEVILAAQLGNALLLENRQLKEQKEKIHEQYASKLEELEQDRHDLRLKLEGSQSQWESQVGDLERDVRDLVAQMEQLTWALGEAERDKSRVQLEHGEQSRLLREELHSAKEMERAMSSELQALKQELQHKGSPNRQQDEELISAMREQVLRLTQKEQTLEKHLESVCQENAQLGATLASLQARLDLHDQLKQQHSQQLDEALKEVELAQGRSQQLQAQVEELQEKVSLQESRSHLDSSLLTELETAELGVSRAEITQEVGSILGLLLPLTRDPNSPEKSEVMDEQEDLQAVLHRLKGVARNLAGESSPQELNLGFVDGTSDHCGNLSAAQELRDQNIQLQEENAELLQKLQNIQDQTDFVQQAIRDRDEAIAKKNLMEDELLRSKHDMMSLNNQLLDAIHRKLELSQELEAWQDDIQIVINQQLKSQQQSEKPQLKPASNGLSFFRRPSKIISSWSHQSSSSFCSSDTNQDKVQSPWKDWLRLGKGTQFGK